MKDSKDTIIRFTAEIKWRGDRSLTMPSFIRESFLRKGTSFTVQKFDVLSREILINDEATKRKSETLIQRSVGSTMLKQARKHTRNKIKIGTTKASRAGQIVSFSILSDDYIPITLLLRVNDCNDGTMQMSLRRCPTNTGWSGDPLVENAARLLKYISINTFKNNQEDDCKHFQKINIADPIGGEKLATDIDKAFGMMTAYPEAHEIFVKVPVK